MEHEGAEMCTQIRVGFVQKGNTTIGDEYTKRGHRDQISPTPKKEGGNNSRTTKNLETRTGVLGIDTKNDG